MDREASTVDASKIDIKTRECNQVRLAALSGLKVGMWSSREHEALWLATVPKKKLFLFIVQSTNDQACSPRHSRLRRNAEALLRLTRASSPFRVSLQDEDNRTVILFEVHFECVSGVAYDNPLIGPGRLVLEAHAMKRYEFNSLSEALKCYELPHQDSHQAPASITLLQTTPSAGDATPNLTPMSPLVNSNGQFNMKETCNDKRSRVERESHKGSLRVRSNLMHRLQNVTQETTESVLSTDETKRSESIGQNRKEHSSKIKGAMTKRFSFFRHKQLSSGDGSGYQGTHAETAKNREIQLSNKSVDSSCGSMGKVEGRRSPVDEAHQSEATSVWQEVSFGDGGNSASQPNGPYANDTSPLSLSRKVTEHEALNTSSYFEFRLISAYWIDPNLPSVLRPSIERDERLLRLYESGLPSWAVFLPQHGFPYRPYMRQITWVLFYLWTFVSLALGFYDLYKCLPGLQDLLQKFASMVRFPMSATLAWIETHTKIRLSILLTYLFGKTPMIGFVARMAGSFFQALQTAALEPLTNVMGTIVPPLAALVSVIFSPVLWILTLVQYAWSTLVNMFCPMVSLIGQSLSLAVNAILTGSASARTTSSSPWIAWFSVTVPWMAFRELIVRASRSTQAVLRFFITALSATVRHRMTLSRRARRQWIVTKTWTRTKLEDMYCFVCVVSRVVIQRMTLTTTGVEVTELSIESVGSSDVGGMAKALKDLKASPGQTKGTEETKEEEKEKEEEDTAVSSCMVKNETKRDKLD